VKPNNLIFIYLSSRKKSEEIRDKISYLISSYLIERREEEEEVVVVVFTKFLTQNISTYGLRRLWYGLKCTSAGWMESITERRGWLAAVPDQVDD
jgi:hypothetical protein